MAAAIALDDLQVERRGAGGSGRSSSRSQAGSAGDGSRRDGQHRRLTHAASRR